MNDKGIVNFRDIGGTQVAGGYLKPGYFYRSGEISGLNPEQVSFLEHDCQLYTIFDFRSQNEVAKDPDTTIPGTHYVKDDILSDQTKNGASLAGMFANGGHIRDAMLKTYEQIVLSGSAQAGYREFFDAVINERKPTLFHCFAGKDRTGFAAAVILKMAGASDDVIMTDYLLTNQLRKEANAKLLAQFKLEVNEEQLRNLSVALLVDRDYLLHARETIINQFGSFEGYLKSGLKLDSGYVEAFRQAFVTPK
ncbi:tyrosine-protein phosphatase [Lentilactobacillus kisonensis]|nr:tyrosine-protein phosphatase [Lentilactobacillus kisonensis]